MAHQITLILVNHNDSNFFHSCLKQPLDKNLEIAFTSPPKKDNKKEGEVVYNLIVCMLNLLKFKSTLPCLLIIILLIAEI